MAPRKSAINDPSGFGYVTMTPNQVVAHNLTRAREWKGWTQEQLADALEPFLGKRWSKASVSQAERSVAGKFIRQFDADEIVAFARALDLPVGWFFMPPPPWDDTGAPVKLSTPDAKEHGANLAELIDIVFGDTHAQAVLELRLQAFLQQLGPRTALSQKQDAVARTVNAKINAIAHNELHQLEQWQTQLRAIANHLEDLHTRAQTQLADDVGRSDT